MLLFFASISICYFSYLSQFSSYHDSPEFDTLSHSCYEEDRQTSRKLHTAPARPSFRAAFPLRQKTSREDSCLSIAPIEKTPTQLPGLYTQVSIAATTSIIMSLIKFWERDRTNFPGVVIPLAPSTTTREDRDSPRLPPLYFQTQSDYTADDKEEGVSAKGRRSSSSDPEKGRITPSSVVESECAPLTLETLKAEILSDHTTDPNGSPSVAYDSTSLAPSHSTIY